MIREHRPARFRWLDLAAVDAGAAIKFYQGMFGWRAKRFEANGGEIFRFMHQDEDIASLYQLSRQQIEGGVPSHWTPYVAVSDMEDAASKAEKLGGQMVVRPFDVDGMARVALVADSVGGLVGLWELPG